jgi:hypothetical protein
VVWGRWKTPYTPSVLYPTSGTIAIRAQGDHMPTRAGHKAPFGIRVNRWAFRAGPWPYRGVVQIRYYAHCVSRWVVDRRHAVGTLSRACPEHAEGKGGNAIIGTA